jgi:hypothetical protein
MSKVIGVVLLMLGMAVGQNGTAPVYNSTTSTANPGTITPLFTGTTGVNQVAYDTTYNTYPLDPYTRVTDSTTIGGKSVGNNTCAGGSNEYTWSKGGSSTKFLGFAQGGAFYILYLDTSGAAAQVINTGNISAVDVLCPVAFSRVTDNFLWSVASNHTTIQKNVITLPYNGTITTTTVKDLSTCPGLSGLSGWSWNGILSVSNNDTRFSMDMGNTGGQDTGVWQVTYDTTLGCSAINMAGGPDWTASTAYASSFNTVNIITPLSGNAGGYSYEVKVNGTSGASSAPTWPQTVGATVSDGTGALIWVNVGVGGVYYAFGSATPASLVNANTCTTALNCSAWGGPIHDGQMGGDGTQVMITEYGTWQRGAANGINTGTMLSMWQVGTQYTQFCSTLSSGLGGLGCGGHGSVGTSHILDALSTSPATFRSLSNVLTYTTFEVAPSQAWSAHGFWPQPDQADDYPYIQATYSLLSTQGTGCTNGANWCPDSGGAAISAIYPGNVGAYPPGQLRTFFGHTYTCGGPGDSTCPGSTHDTYFGCQESIISVSQDGNWVALPSGMLLSLGLDSTSTPRCDLFVIHIGSAGAISGGSLTNGSMSGLSISN